MTVIMDDLVHLVVRGHEERKVMREMRVRSDQQALQDHLDPTPLP